MFQDRDPEMGEKKIRELLEHVDTYIPDPIRDLDKPFYLPIDGIHSIPGNILQIYGSCFEESGQNMV